MRIWLILEKKELTALNLRVHEELKDAEGRQEIHNYLPCDAYAVLRYHPTLNKVASKYDLNKTESTKDWNPYILKHINEDDLVVLTEDWTVEDYE
jgi:hypothetical protein